MVGKCGHDLKFLHEFQLNEIVNELFKIVPNFRALGAVFFGEPIDDVIQIGLKSNPQHAGSGLIEPVGIA